MKTWTACLIRFTEFLAAPRPQQHFVVDFSTDYVRGFGEAKAGTFVEWKLGVRESGVVSSTTKL